MTAYRDEWLTILGGDCRDVLRTLPASSVHCVITSPPYWGLRDYGTASWTGGDEDCDHRRTGTRDERPRSGLQGGTATVNHAQEPAFKAICGKCGATRQDSQLGLEATPEEYVTTLVDVFREVRRVLRDDGTLWLNLGDSYAGSGKGPEGNLNAGMSFRHLDGTTKPYVGGGLKPKDLVGIPWRVAFALQADGWYLRSDIIWSKPNPMPESVTDRPTKSHEYLFLLSKSPRYYFDADAVREQGQDWSKGGPGTGIVPTNHYHPDNGGNEGLSALAGRYKNGSQAAGRNIRSVWTIATAPYPGAHFATFPPKLVEPCVKAGTSERGVCPECGAPWARVVERTGLRDLRVGDTAPKHVARTEMGMRSVRSGLGGSNNHSDSMPQSPIVTTTGWRPTCKHDAEPAPGVVLDPFAGTGTVGMVAQSLSRRAVLIDLNPSYLKQCLSRNQQTPLGLTVG